MFNVMLDQVNEVERELFPVSAALDVVPGAVGVQSLEDAIQLREPAPDPQMLVAEFAAYPGGAQKLVQFGKEVSLLPGQVLFYGLGQALLLDPGVLPLQCLLTQPFELLQPEGVILALDLQGWAVLGGGNIEPHKEGGAIEQAEMGALIPVRREGRFATHQ